MEYKKLSRAALEHGELQVCKMLRDRPAMRGHLTPADEIWKWAARKFSGEDLPDTIDWDNRRPYQGARSSHVYPVKSERGFITVTNRKSLSFEELWAAVIFELHNIALYVEFHRIILWAYKGKISKKEFSLKMAQTEFKAVKQTERFYKKVWEPWAKSKGLATFPGEWYVGVPAKFKDWISHFGKNSAYLWKTYAHFYDHHLEEWAREEI